MRNKEWWKESVVYQIYPKSFQDSNGDGLGDIRGIIQRIDYIKTLGADIIWLCPIYQSPMDDGGYDISDYYTIDSLFGTNEDLYELIEVAKECDIKILMDLVVNHTSDEHFWFQEALKNPESKYRNYYIFREGYNNQPPNNWRSYFGDSAWEKVPGEKNTYYLHAFTKKQPDLNWENEEVREEIYKMITFWLAKGLGGFRIDAILNLKKKIDYGQLPVDGEDGRSFIGKWILNQPGIEVWLNEMKQNTFNKYNCMTVAEADVPDQQLPNYIGQDGIFSMVFDFSYTDIDVPETGEWFKESNWTWNQMRAAIFHSQLITQKYGWAATYLENHDQPRSVNKYIPSDYINDYSKKMLATLFMFLRGTPFIYQGQEIGMENNSFTDIADFDDVATKAQYYRSIESGLNESQALEVVNQRSRDHSRTPMQWNDKKNAGFSISDKIWIKLNNNYKEINVANQLSDINSVLNYYKTLIRLRKNSIYSHTIIYGDFVEVDNNEDDVIIYTRVLKKDKLLIIVNPSRENKLIDIPLEYEYLVISNYEEIEKDKTKILLRPFESMVLANYGDLYHEN